MGRSKFGFEKRQKEMARKQKQEEKRLKKLARSQEQRETADPPPDASDDDVDTEAPE